MNKVGWVISFKKNVFGIVSWKCTFLKISLTLNDHFESDVDISIQIVYK